MRTFLVVDKSDTTVRDSINTDDPVEALAWACDAYQPEEHGNLELVEVTDLVRKWVDDQEGIAINGKMPEPKNETRHRVVVAIEFLVLGAANGLEAQELAMKIECRADARVLPVDTWPVEAAQVWPSEPR